MTPTYQLVQYQVWWWRWLFVPLVLVLAMLGIGPYWRIVAYVAARSWRQKLVRLRAVVAA